VFDNRCVDQDSETFKLYSFHTAAMDRKAQSHQRLIGAAFILVSLTVGCHSSVDAVTAEKARKAREWMRFNPSVEWGDTLDESRWRVVLDSKESGAEAMLQAASAVPLTDGQALELVGEPPMRPNTNTRPFLIRAVGSHFGTSGFEIHTNKNGDLTAIGEALSHHDIPPERRPIVIWLENPPHEIYLWFSVAA
jgi:hypothetical protein